MKELIGTARGLYLLSWMMGGASVMAVYQSAKVIHRAVKEIMR